MDLDDDRIEEDVVLDEQQVVEEEIENDAEDSEQTDNEPETIQDDEDEEDRIVTIGDSETDAPSGEEDSEDKPETPKWVKTLRKVNRKQESEIKRLKKQLEENQKAIEKDKPIELGDKPTLATCNYDDKKFEAELDDWKERKRKVEAQQAEKQKLVEEQNKAYEAKRSRYVEKKQEYKFKDFAEVEEIVTDTLSEIQQSIIIDGTEDSALVVYALGKNPKKLEEMANITNPIEFAVKLGKLEDKLNIKNRKAPAPEKKVSSGKTGATGQSDKVLDRLRAEAERTGDFTEVRKYKDKLRKG